MRLAPVTRLVNTRSSQRRAQRVTGVHLERALTLDVRVHDAQRQCSAFAAVIRKRARAADQLDRVELGIVIAQSGVKLEPNRPNVQCETNTVQNGRSLQAVVRTRFAFGSPACVTRHLRAETFCSRYAQSYGA